MVDIQDKQVNNKPKRDKKGRLLPGNTANLAGRPKGKTIKEKIREIFLKDPKRFNKTVNELINEYPTLVWQMLEGRPPMDLHLEGEMKLPFIIKVIKDDRKPEIGGTDSPVLPKTI